MQLRRRKAAQVAVVALVHGEHVVERVHVLERRLAPAQRRDVDAAARGGLAGARVGRLADVVGVGAGGVDDDVEPGAVLGEQLPQHALRRRRAADVAQTDEQDLDHEASSYTASAGKNHITHGCAAFCAARDCGARCGR